MKFIYRHYWNEDETHAFYQNMLHTTDDKKFAQVSQLEKLFEAADVKDGDEIEIIVRKTGNRPFDKIWKSTAPHVYSPVEKWSQAS